MICVIKNSKVFAIHTDEQVAEIRNKYSGLDIIHVADSTNVTLGGTDPRDLGATWKDARLLKGIVEIEDELLSHLAETASKHIKESGSNANGIYIKFDDGTMICWTRWAGGVTLTANVVNIIEWTFPAEFYVSSPVSFVNPYFYGSVSPYEVIYSICRSYHSNLQRTKTSLLIKPNVGDLHFIEAVAIGRWK